MMPFNQVRPNIIKALKHLRERVILGDPHLDAGICECFRETADMHGLKSEYTYTTLFFTWFNPIVKTWPKYSGDLYYPIPSLTKRATPYRDYNLSKGQRWTGEYLKLRLELIDFVIEELEKDEPT